MESTAKYRVPIFNIPEPHMHVVLTHTKYVKAIKGKKTDRRDAKWIANLFRFDIVKSLLRVSEPYGNCPAIV